MILSINSAPFHAPRRRARVLATGAIVLAVVPSGMMAQGKSAAAPKPWHLSAPQLATECRATIADMRAAVDAAVKQPLAAQTFANTLRPIEEANGRVANAHDHARQPALSLPGQGGARLVYGVQSARHQLRRRAAGGPAHLRRRTRRRRRSRCRRSIGRSRSATSRTAATAERRSTRPRACARRRCSSASTISSAISASRSAATARASRCPDSEIAPLPEQIKGQIEPRGDQKTLRVDESTIGLFLRNQPSSDARRRYLYAYQRRGGEANIARLGQAVALRDSLAHLFGFPSWAAYQLDVKVAKTPQRATEFIKQIDEGLLTKARRELAELGPVAEQDHLGHPIAVWDLSYYSEKLRRARYAVDANEVRKYFPVEHVVSSVLDIYQQLFGIALTEVKPADVWAPGVRQYTVRDATTHAAHGHGVPRSLPAPRQVRPLRRVSRRSHVAAPRRYARAAERGDRRQLAGAGRQGTVAALA